MIKFKYNLNTRFFPPTRYFLTLRKNKNNFLPLIKKYNKSLEGPQNFEIHQKYHFSNSSNLKFLCVTTSQLMQSKVSGLKYWGSFSF